MCNISGSTDLAFPWRFSEATIPLHGSPHAHASIPCALTEIKGRNQGHYRMGYEIKWKLYRSNRPGILKNSFLSMYTDSTKINRPVHSIRMYWTNFRQPTAHVQQNISGKTLIQGEQRICERSWKYKVICQKVDNPAQKVFTF